MTDVLKLQSQKRTLKGNEPLPLNQLDTAWVIESGSVALFAVPIEAEGMEGARRYLFSATDHAVIFGMDPASSKTAYHILAVAIEATTLQRLSLDEFLQFQTEANGAQSLDAPSLLELWRDRLLSVFEGSKITFRPKAPGQVNEPELLSAYLEKLHSEFFRRFDRLEKQGLEIQQTQFEDRQRLNQQMTETALGQLASIVNPKDADFFQEGTPLLIAAGAVGRAMGMTIRPPARSNDESRIKEPLEAITRASRIRMRRVILSGLWWEKDCGPLLAYTVSDNRPIALLPKGKQYEIFDPEQRTRTWVTPDNVETISPLAFTFYPSLPETHVKAWEFLQFALKGRGKDLLFLGISGVIATLLGMLTPQATAMLIDQAIPSADRGLLIQVGVGLLAAGLGVATFQITQEFATIRIQTIADVTSQAALWDRLLKLRVSFFRQYPTGDLKSRVSAITQIRTILSGPVLRTLFTSFFSLLNLVILFIYSPPLAAVALVLAMLAIITTAIAGMLNRQQLGPLQEIEGRIFGLMVQLIGGISKLHVAGAEDRAFAYWAKNYNRQLQLTRKSQILEDFLAVFNTMLPSVSAIVIFAIAALVLQESTGHQGLSTGTFLAFNAAFGTFILGATTLSNTLVNAMEVAVLWDRAKPILAAEPEVDLSKADPGRLQGHIKVDHVTFRYRSDGPLNLDDVTIEAKPGEFIALVGPSGSGKSTIIRLMLGFETPEDGAIYYDGQDFSGLDVSAVRRQLGVVLQNGRINSASIFENISSGALVTMDEAWEAAKMAGFSEDIDSMPMGMHTVISEGGTNLSGGQRQRLLIARSLVQKPRILIFDEATSALDNRTQQIVTESIDQLQVTRIVIAHRLSTIRNADRIYVIEAGRVVQQGSFDELAQTPGMFANLMARQMA